MNVETANRLYELRKKFGYSQEELAEKIGVSRQAISKWERSEASPDTDNLIMLSRVYGITIDELINGSAQSENPPNDEHEEKKDDKKSTHIHFNNGIHIDDGDDHVHIDFSGIHIDSDDSKVHIDKDGVFISDEDEIKVDTATEKEQHPILHAFKQFPYPILALLAYLAFGFWNVFGGWAAGWVVFLTVPIYYSILDSIQKKNPKEFAFPVLVTGVYVYLGIMYGLWHPYWIMFILVPLYDGICRLFFPEKKGDGYKVKFNVSLGNEEDKEDEEDLEEIEN